MGLATHGRVTRDIAKGEALTEDASPRSDALCVQAAPDASCIADGGAIATYYAMRLKCQARIATPDRIDGAKYRRRGIARRMSHHRCISD
jgi:hypothetical protein